MARSSLEIDITDVRTTLARIDPALDKELRQTFKKYALEGRNLVKANAPVRTGALRDSFMTRTSFTKTKSRAMVTTKPQSTVRYQWILEHGRKTGSPMPGRFYVRRAADVILPKAKREIEADVARVLRGLQ